MKARWVIFGALLLAAMVSPAALRAMPRVPPVLSPCPIAKSQIRTSYDRQHQKAPREVAYSLPGQHRPAPRLHRNRGKKISVERGLLILPGSCTRSQYVFAAAAAPLDAPDGPNPSRGPPADAL